MTGRTCLAHGAPFTTDPWGDARHGEGRCDTGPRIRWSCVDGAGGEDRPDLTDDEARAETDREQRAAEIDGNPLGYRYACSFGWSIPLYRSGR